MIRYLNCSIQTSIMQQTNTKSTSMNHYAKIKLTPMQVQWDSIFKKQAVLIAVFMVNIATVLD